VRKTTSSFRCNKLTRRFIPKADIKVFKGAGHLVLDERREAVDAVQQFLT
jgi:hypothetical protein